MNRFDVHLNVSDLEASVGFHSQLFAAAPVLRKPGYAKWMLDDPRVNFAISTTCCATGIDHLGIQVDSSDALEALGQGLQASGRAVLPEPDATCCYACSDKSWIEDPQGLRWEAFHTFGQAVAYHADGAAPPADADAAACAPAACSPAISAAPTAGCC